ncbi:unnamed protein product, partial [Didymodactylos carnosus]
MARISYDSDKNQ